MIENVCVCVCLDPNYIPFIVIPVVFVVIATLMICAFCFCARRNGTRGQQPMVGYQPVILQPLPPGGQTISKFI